MYAENLIAELAPLYEGLEELQGKQIISKKKDKYEISLNFQHTFL